MKSLQEQQGVGLINFILIVFVVGFCANFAIKVVPMYADNKLVVTGLKGLTEPGINLAQMSDAEIKKSMSNFYMLNNVSSEGAKNIIIDRSAEKLVVKIDYESRANLFMNIDVAMKFVNHLDSARPLQCCTPLVEAKSAKY